jgi:sulfite reductase (NADPH) flavoprotein alpha-component
MILVGNGTGIAGLRAHLKQRIAAGARRNWLLFGERNAERDFFYGDEIRQWQAQGWLERVDLAFSRDQAERIYVQHKLQENAELLRRWLDDGACLFVCGSLDGMAPGVDSVLRQAIGDDAVENLLIEGRYRRDVY